MHLSGGMKVSGTLELKAIIRPIFILASVIDMEVAKTTASFLIFMIIDI